MNIPSAKNLSVAALCGLLLVVGATGCGGSSSKSDDQAASTSEVASTTPHKDMPKATADQCDAMSGMTENFDDLGAPAGLSDLVASGGLTPTVLNSFQSLLRQAVTAVDTSTEVLPDAVKPQAKVFVDGMVAILKAIGTVDPNGVTPAQSDAIKAAVNEQAPKITEAIAEVKQFVADC